MGVDISTYRCRIGTHNICCGTILITLYVDLTTTIKVVGSVIFVGLLLLMSGIEPNPGPRGRSTNSMRKGNGISKEEKAEGPINTPEEEYELRPLEGEGSLLAQAEGLDFDLNQLSGESSSDSASLDTRQKEVNIQEVFNQANVSNRNVIVNMQLKNTGQLMMGSNNQMISIESREYDGAQSPKHEDFEIESVMFFQEMLEELNEWIEDPEFTVNFIYYLNQISEKVENVFNQTGKNDLWLYHLKKNQQLHKFFKLVMNPSLEVSESECEVAKLLIRKMILPVENRSFLNKLEILKWLKSTDEFEKLPSVLSNKLLNSIDELSSLLKNAFLPDIRRMENSKQHPNMQDPERIACYITVELALAVRRLYNHFIASENAAESILLNALLIPFSYNFTTLGFDIVITRPKLEEFTESTVRAAQSYDQYKNKSSLQGQAFLVYFVSETLIQDNKYDIMKKESVFMDVVMSLKHFFSREITILLDRFTASSPFDWEVLGQCVRLYMQGETKIDFDQTLSLETLKSALLETNSSNEKKQVFDESFDTTLQFSQILTALGLLDYFPDKITIQQVMVVTKHTDDKNIEFSDIPWIILREMVMGNFRSRDNILSSFYSSHEADSIVFGQADLDDIDSIVADMGDDVKESQSHNPLDVFVAIFSCCDFLLKQTLAEKLLMCKLAIPLVFAFSARELRFSLWPITSLSVEVKGSEIPLVKHPTKIITSIQIQRPKWSKSKVMNDVLRHYSHNTFFWEECPLGNTQKTISEGMMEISWFIPSGKSDDLYNDILAFVNLRGDASKYPNQIEFAREITNIFVVFTDFSQLEKEENSSIFVSLYQRSAAVVLVLTKREEDSAAMKRALEHFKQRYSSDMQRTKFIPTLKSGKKRDANDLKMEIRKVLSGFLESQSGTSLEECGTIAKKSGVLSDSKSGICMMERKNATKLFKHVKAARVPNIKEKLLPLQGQLWTTYSTYLKQKQKIGLRNGIYEKELLLKKMIDVRHQQAHQINILPPFMSEFIRALLEKVDNRESVLYFLQWLKIYFDDNSRTILPGLLKKYRDSWNELRSVKERKNQPDLHSFRKAVDDSERELVDNSFGIEHVIREIGQIYESVNECTDIVCSDTKNIIEELPLAVAKLIRYGHPFEVMDGDAACVPLQWVKAVFTHLQNLIGDAKMLAISVIGIQSSGKSTLLNTMFGLKFAVSAGRCTRGIFMQLVPVDKTKSGLNFDYVLVIDTEGLRAPELVQQMYEHDNKLATLVIGMGDVTIVNIKGENTSEVKDVLQITVHAFLRLKLVNDRLKLRKSCIFVHQNVPSANADDKMLHGRQKLIENLDALTVEAANQEQITDIESFNDVIYFDSRLHIWYFSDLWSGDPPMAPSNPGYVERVQEVKQCILEKTVIQNNSLLKLSDRIVNICDLWEGILADDFVFGFQNSLEIKAYNCLEMKFQEVLYLMEQYVNDLKQKEAKDISLQCSTIEKMDVIMPKVLSSINEKIRMKAEELYKILDGYFSNNDLRDITMKWKSYKMINFGSNIDILIKQTEVEMLEYKEQRRIAMVNGKHEMEYETEINKKAAKLASNFKGEYIEDSQLENIFEETWIQWVNQMAARVPIHHVSVEDVVKNKLYQLLTGADYVLTEELKHFPLSNNLDIDCLEGSIHSKEITKQHISVKRTFCGLKKPGWDKCTVQAIFVTDVIFRQVDVFLNDLMRMDTKFSEAHVSKILNFVSDGIKNHNNQSHDSYQFTFLKPYTAKLSVHVCRFAIKRFISMNDEYNKKHSFKAHIESYKESAWLYFRNMVNQKTEEKIAATFFWETISERIKYSVVSILPDIIENEILCNFSRTKYHLVVEIMDDLAKKADFPSYQKYIADPYTFAFEWITIYTNDKFFQEKENGKTRLVQLATVHVQNLLKLIQKGIIQSTKEARGYTGFTIYKWVNCFEEIIRSELLIYHDTLQHVKHRNISDVADFQKLLLQGMDKTAKSIYAYFESLSDKNILWPKKTPYQGIMDKLWGCKAFCPFCHEPCQKSDNHSTVRGGGSHTCIQHRPPGVRGLVWITGPDCGRLVVENCNFSVQHDGASFRCSACDYLCTTSKKCKTTKPKKSGYKSHAYIEYKTYIPKWDIAPMSGHESSKYWIWFLATYQHQLANAFNCKLPRLPQSWTKIKRQQARESLRKAIK